ncbi:uncharacterized protein LOC143869801 [Tasmannia lanceolata]|uniref:uncharacterized protein LOC143869801 n=1 Tax=Tasmannia lanceolata TaxID=3420 RepID=UPI004063DE40
MKLSPRFYGLYRVLQRIGIVAYKLELPAGPKIQLVFHVSCLKRNLGDQLKSQNQLPATNERGEIQFQPHTLLDRRIVKQGNRAITEVLVQWANLPAKDATWENFQNLREHFPDFALNQP